MRRVLSHFEENELGDSLVNIRLVVHVTGMESKCNKRKVREADRIYWMPAMEKKLVLSNYQNDDNEMMKAFYDLREGPSVFEARSCCLRTRSYKARFSKVTIEILWAR